jgi:hypothetical protein
MKSRFTLILLSGLCYVSIAGCNRLNRSTATKQSNDNQRMNRIQTAPLGAVRATMPIRDYPLRLPSPPERTAIDDSQIRSIKAKLKKFPTFNGYRLLAGSYINAGRFQDAANALRAEAAMYRAKGLSDAAVIKERLADRYSTKVQIFVDHAMTAGHVNPFSTGAPIEPAAGCLLGAFIDRDDRLKKTYMDENWQTHRTPQEFARLTRKRHATHFMYLKYGNKFPLTWIEDCKNAGVIPQIAWEPEDLGEVKDDDYLRSFAQKCQKVNWPIFFRFAAEMNGAWTLYHANPKLYREKFRLVHRVLHRYAPRIATIWCVNNPPLDDIDQYYPGDDGCDWVGVNFYNVVFYDNDRGRPAVADSPLGLLDPIYQKYARRKPIAICEYAASHMAAIDRIERTSLAVDKMAEVYSALPLRYPRVKLIDWLNMNTILHPQPGKNLNDYTLTQNGEILNEYRSLIKNPYFLSSYKPGKMSADIESKQILPGQWLSRDGELTVMVKTYVPRPLVLLKVGDRIIYARRQPGSHTIQLKGKRLKLGKSQVSVYIYDDRNHYVTSLSVPITIGSDVRNERRVP